MSTVVIRKQGGAAVVTIPSDILKKLHVKIGSKLELSIDKDNLVAHPVKRTRVRYTLNELLKGVTKEKMEALNKETEWAREGGPVGNEIA